MSVRPSDPWTSNYADLSIRNAAATQREIILSVYRDYPDGLTDEEAAEIAKVQGCWWKRCSELRQHGLIVDTGRVRAGAAGRPRIVCRVPAPHPTTLFEMGGTR